MKLLNNSATQDPKSHEKVLPMEWHACNPAGPSCPKDTFANL